MFGPVVRCGEANIAPPLNLVCLIPVCASHLVSYTKWRRDYDVMKWMGQVVDRPDEVQNWYERRRDDDNSMFWSIVLCEERTDLQELLIGVVGITSIDWSTRVGGVSIMIGEKEAWRKGVATITLSALVKFARDSLGLRGLRVEALMPNVGCIKAAEHAGFTQCGTWPDIHLIGDEYVDMWLGYQQLSE